MGFSRQEYWSGVPSPSPTLHLVVGNWGEGDDRGWDGCMASLTGWTWVWVNSEVRDGQGGLACCYSWGRRESDTTEWLSWTELNWTELYHFGLPWWLSSERIRLQCRRPGFDPWFRKPNYSISWSRKWLLTPVFLPGKAHRGAWSVIVYGVSKIWTRLSDWTITTELPGRLAKMGCWAPLQYWVDISFSNRSWKNFHVLTLCLLDHTLRTSGSTDTCFPLPRGCHSSVRKMLLSLWQKCNNIPFVVSFFVCFLIFLKVPQNGPKGNIYKQLLVKHS